ncbi:MAG TPA: hypothetical protein VHD35_13790 [Chitinophagaceae bacterium]|nr:hypothetical protein [Chitinophagaceae bacterium]
MQTSNELVLIEGAFNVSDAGRLLYSFIDSKINYHHMEMFSVREQSINADVSRHEKRISELKQAREQLKAILELANKNNKRLLVNSVIKIEWAE